jgi:hypothetical protein
MPSSEPLSILRQLHLLGGNIKWAAVALSALTIATVFILPRFTKAVGFARAFVLFFKTDKSVDVLAIRTSDTNCVAPLSHAQVNGPEIAVFLEQTHKRTISLSR